jgi:uncharacterized protein YecT (DUF1311 family)
MGSLIGHRAQGVKEMLNRRRRPLVLATVLFAVLSLGGIPARAQHMNEKDSPCADVVQTAELAHCLSKARDSSDDKLNSLYKSLRKKLDTSDAERLTAAQRLWIQYRDANCSAEQKLYDGGTASSSAYLACLEAMTRMRTKELQVTYAVKFK